MTPVLRFAGAAFVTLAVAHGFSARADDRPQRFDMNGLCGRQANTPDGRSSEVEQRCIMAQSDAQASVRRIWPTTPVYIQRDCTLRARAEGEGDYALLLKCIRDQLGQAQPDVVLPKR
ncbi:MAG: hypothetical protein F8N37_12430 [Telmatospirillum sp.]|nr:hypothetical protein [Telmatospirillum sp.]